MDDWIRKLSGKARENESRIRDWIRETVGKQEPPVDERREAPGTEHKDRSTPTDEAVSVEGESDGKERGEDEASSLLDEHRVLHAIAADALLRRVRARMKKTPEMLSSEHHAGASLAKQIHQHLQAAPTFHDARASGLSGVNSSPVETSRTVSSPPDEQFSQKEPDPTEEREPPGQQKERVGTLGTLFVAWCR